MTDHNDWPVPDPNEPTHECNRIDKLKDAIHSISAATPLYNQLSNFCEFAVRYVLELLVRGKSWYNLGPTVHVFLYPAGRYP